MSFPICLNFTSCTTGTTYNILTNVTSQAFFSAYIGLTVRLDGTTFSCGGGACPLPQEEDCYTITTATCTANPIYVPWFNIVPLPSPLDFEEDCNNCLGVPTGCYYFHDCNSSLVVIVTPDGRSYYISPY